MNPGDTNEILIQTGGQSNHSTITKILRVKNPNTRDTEYLHIEYNAGAGASDVGEDNARIVVNAKRIKTDDKTAFKTISDLINIERKLKLVRPMHWGPNGGSWREFR